MLELYRSNGKEHFNYYRVFWGYIGIISLQYMSFKVLDPEAFFSSIAGLLGLDLGLAALIQEASLQRGQ